MSLLLGNGHRLAQDYPIGHLLDEAEIVSERLNQLAGQQAVLTLMALSATPNMGVKADSTKKAHKDFVAFTQMLMGADDGE